MEHLQMYLQSNEALRCTTISEIDMLTDRAIHVRIEADRVLSHTTSLIDKAEKVLR
jgi:hypothetical protein